MEKVLESDHEVIEIDGREKVLHKKCAEILKKGGEVVRRFFFP
jgi:hypothetical protein